MTTAPACLVAARRLLLDHLDIHDSGSYPSDLDPAEVGIVGDPDHRGGYHCGSDRVVTGDYSVVESSRDRNGLSLDAAALDVGWFKVTTPKGTFDLRHYSRWLVHQCEAGTADTRDIREVIYSPDGEVVRRWDRLGIRSSGDLSHRTHTHKSYFRDAIKAGRDQTAVLRRYLTEIGLGDDMLSDDDKPIIGTAVHAQRLFRSDLTIGDVLYALRGVPQQLTAARAELAAIRGADPVDEEAIVSGVLAGLGTRPVAEVAAALVAAGQDPRALAEALTALAPQG